MEENKDIYCMHSVNNKGIFCTGLTLTDVKKEIEKVVTCKADYSAKIIKNYETCSNEIYTKVISTILPNCCKLLTFARGDNGIDYIKDDGKLNVAKLNVDLAKVEVALRFNSEDDYKITDLHKLSNEQIFYLWNSMVKYDDEVDVSELIVKNTECFLRTFFFKIMHFSIKEIITIDTINYSDKDKFFRYSEHAHNLLSSDDIFDLIDDEKLLLWISKNEDKIRDVFYI